MCDAIIANGGVREPSKCPNVCDDRCIKHGSDSIRHAKRDFAAKPRENLACGICTSLRRKRFFWMTRVQPHTDNLVRFASVIWGILPFVKLERLTFVDLVTLPFVNPCNTAICQNMQLKITSTI